MLLSLNVGVKRSLLVCRHSGELGGDGERYLSYLDVLTDPELIKEGKRNFISGLSRDLRS